MSRIQYVVGSTNSGKSTALYNRIIKLAEKDFRKKYFIIVPEQFTIETQRALTLASSNGAIMNVDVLSFNRLAWRIFEETGESTKLVLEDTGKNMIIRRLLSDLKGKFTYFSNASGKNGFTEDMKSLITELFQYNVTSEGLAVMEKTAGSEGIKNSILAAKLSDTKLILDAFNEYKKEKYITAEEVLDLLVKVLPESKLVNDALFAFDGFTGFTPGQIDLIRALSHKASDLLFTVTVDRPVFEGRQPDMTGLFSLSLDTVSRLDKIVKEENITATKTYFTDYRPNACEIRHLSDNIFRYPAAVMKLDGESNVTVNICSDPSDEAYFVASEIKRLVHEKNLRYRDIAVAAGDISIYGETIARIFSEGGIPYFIDQNRNIMADPFVEMVRSSLSVIADDYTSEAVMRFLRSGFADIEISDIDIFENYILQKGVRGKKRYSKTFLTEKVKSKYADDEYSLDIITRADSVREYVSSLFAPLSEAFSEKERTAGSVTKVLYKFITDLDCAAKMEAMSKELSDRGEAVLAKEFSQCYELVIQILEKMNDLLGDEKLSTEDYVKIMESGFSEQKAGIIPPGLDQVLVGDLVRSRLPGIKVLFAVGFNDGLVPKGETTKGILTDRERRALHEAGFELAPTAREKSRREQFYIYMNLSKPEKALYISYSTHSSDGGELNPSYFIERIEHLFDGNIKKDRTGTGDALTEYRRDEGKRLVISAMNKDGNSNRTAAGTLGKILTNYDSKWYKAVLVGHRSKNTYDSLQIEAAKSLYGKLTGSVSRLELFAACPFAHFMKYGLELQDRKYYSLSLPDLGTIYHAIIEVFEKKVVQNDISFAELSKNDELRNRLCDESIDAVTGDENNILHSDERLLHMIDRIRRIMRRTVLTVTEQAAAGDFTPLLFEESFIRNGMTGRIDRVDLASSDTLPDGSKINDADNISTIEYARIIDYKTGSKEFDINRVYYGLDLQLMTYIAHVKERIRQMPGLDKSLVLPAGAFYFHISDPTVGKGEGELQILEKMRFNGPAAMEPSVLMHTDRDLVAADMTVTPGAKSSVIKASTGKEGQFKSGSMVFSIKNIELMAKYVSDTEERLKNRILEGYVAPKPYLLKGKTGCDFCPYRASCRFDPKLADYRYNYMKELSADDIFLAMEKKEKE